LDAGSTVSQDTLLASLRPDRRAARETQSVQSDRKVL